MITFSTPVDTKHWYDLYKIYITYKCKLKIMIILGTIYIAENKRLYAEK